MAAEYELSAVLDRAFRAALLLTGNMASAEQAVSSAIESLSFDGLTYKALLYETIVAAIRCDSDLLERTDGDATHDWFGLPIELRAVLDLKPSRRYCFVVRVLLGLPVDDCARLLKIRRADVRVRALEAMQWLAANAQTANSPFPAWPEVVASYSPLWQ